MKPPSKHRLALTVKAGLLVLAAVGCAAGNTGPSGNAGAPVSRPSSTAAKKASHYGKRHRKAVHNSKRHVHRPSSSQHPVVACPSSPLRGVYHAYRLRVLGSCRGVVNTLGVD